MRWPSCKAPPKTRRGRHLMPAAALVVSLFWAIANIGFAVWYTTRFTWKSVLSAVGDGLLAFGALVVYALGTRSVTRGTFSEYLASDIPAAGGASGAGTPVAVLLSAGS